jgi:hypothetical protein
MSCRCLASGAASGRGFNYLNTKCQFTRKAQLGLMDEFQMCDIMYLPLPQPFDTITFR